MDRSGRRVRGRGGRRCRCLDAGACSCGVGGWAGLVSRLDIGRDCTDLGMGVLVEVVRLVKNTSGRMLRERSIVGCHFV